MKSIQFSTNINCGSCVRAVTPTLNQLAGKGNWSVDTENPQKILTLIQDNLDENRVIQELKFLGYTANPIQALV